MRFMVASRSAVRSSGVLGSATESGDLVLIGVE